MRKPLTQEQLDNIIRANTAGNAVEEMVKETDTFQEYRLSDGTYLLIWKWDVASNIKAGSGKVTVGRASQYRLPSEVIRRF